MSITSFVRPTYPRTASGCLTLTITLLNSASDSSMADRMPAHQVQHTRLGYTPLSPIQPSASCTNDRMDAGAAPRDAMDTAGTLPLPHLTCHPVPTVVRRHQCSNSTLPTSTLFPRAPISRPTPYALYRLAHHAHTARTCFLPNCPPFLH